MLVLQDAGAQHRRQGHRDDARAQDRHDDGHREFVQQPADDAAHEDERNEHRGQRNRHRQDGEADFGRALQRRLIRLFAMLDMPDDILQHDDGVVDHEADRQRQRHQRQIVEAVAEQRHAGKGADDGDRQRQRGNDGGRTRAQEDEDHAHHQRAGDQQRDLHVGNGVADD